MDEDELRQRNITDQDGATQSKPEQRGEKNPRC
jgi:hypothetical protein